MTGLFRTHRELARELGVSETTIKSYRSKFPAFLPVAREGKPVRLHAEALDICRRIRALFAEGLSVAQAAQALRAEFREYPQARRAAASPTGGAPAQAVAWPAAPDPQLSARLEALARQQEQTGRRMEQLEAEVRNLATLEAASKALVSQLVEELRAARAEASAPAPGSADRGRPAATPAPPPGPPMPPQPAPAPARDEANPLVLTARKIVTVHGPGGPVASYALRREPSPPPPFPEPSLPPAGFLDLPAVIRSDRGDFLGLPGGQSVRRLVEVLCPEGAPAPSWFEEGADAWTCAIPLGRAQTREMLFERTTTPRGNLVGLIKRMRINETEATPVQLQEIFRQLRDQLA